MSCLRYVHEGDTSPRSASICKVPGSKFTELKGDEKLAAEHEYGIYAKTVKNNPDISDADKAYILEQLHPISPGECSGVGMCLCMARIAHREGYRRWASTGKAAYEEAEHAASLAGASWARELEQHEGDTRPAWPGAWTASSAPPRSKFDLASCAREERPGRHPRHRPRDGPRRSPSRQGPQAGSWTATSGKPNPKERKLRREHQCSRLFAFSGQLLA